MGGEGEDRMGQMEQEEEKVEMSHRDQDGSFTQRQQVRLTAVPSGIWPLSWRLSKGCIPQMSRAEQRVTHMRSCFLLLLPLPTLRCSAEPFCSSQGETIALSQEMFCREPLMCVEREASLIPKHGDLLCEALLVLRACKRDVWGF